VVAHHHHLHIERLCFLAFLFQFVVVVSLVELRASKHTITPNERTCCCCPSRVAKVLLHLHDFMSYSFYLFHSLFVVGVVVSFCALLLLISLCVKVIQAQHHQSSPATDPLHHTNTTTRSRATTTTTSLSEQHTHTLTTVEHNGGQRY